MERRNSAISLRKSQALARATAFKRSAVEAFSTKYTDIVEKHKLGSELIYNVDEGGFSTVHDPSKVSKQVGRVTTGEIRVTGCINALANSIPPVLIFPCAHSNKPYVDWYTTWYTWDTGLQWLLKGGQIS
jgi:hypothetical protein